MHDDVIVMVCDRRTSLYTKSYHVIITTFILTSCTSSVKMPVPGMLRLKGDVTKIHKKKRPDSSSSKASSASVNEGAVDDTISPLWHEEQVEADKVLSRKTTSQKTREDEAKPSHGVTKTDGSVTKTDAELHHEERRRRMVSQLLASNERL